MTNNNCQEKKNNFWKEFDLREVIPQLFPNVRSHKEGQTTYFNPSFCCGHDHCLAVSSHNPSLWHCFSCNKGGDAIEALKCDGKGFKEAVEILTQLKENGTVSYSATPTIPKNNDETAAKIWKNCSHIEKGDAVAVELLRARGFSGSLSCLILLRDK